MLMTKEDVLLQEIKEYLPFDAKLNEVSLENMRNHTIFNDYERFIYDYFYSHILDNGDIVSVYRFLNSHKDEGLDQEYYLSVDRLFTKALFQSQKPLFFFDVDNTITEMGQLSLEKKEYISHYPEKERIILSTGKVYESIKDVVDSCHLEHNMASTLNGSVLVQDYRMTLLEHLGNLSKELIKEINKAHFQILYYTDHEVFSNEVLNERNYHWIQKYNEDYKVESHIPYSDVVKILIFIYDFDEDYLKQEAFIDQLASHYDNLTTYRTGHHSYEILKKNQHKGTTVKLMAQKLGYYYRCSVGCGDSMNDLRLLDYVGRPYMVCDGSEELKALGIPVFSQNRATDINEILEKYK